MDSAETTFSGTPRFEILSQLGIGGSGVVYEVFDRERNARVALKKLRTPSADALLRFKQEFRALEDLQHPNLVVLGELIEDHGDWFFTMELVQGVDFLGYVRTDREAADVDFSSQPTGALDVAGLEASPTPVPVTEGTPTPGGFDEWRLRAALSQLASALAALHGAGKVHRDIKPANIRVTEDGRVALIDLGLATDIERDTLPQLVVGTAAYMAPEQAMSGEVTPAADWYSVGVLLFESLTGRLPFEGAPLEILQSKVDREAPDPSAVIADLPPDLSRLCADLLRRDPATRAGAAQVLEVSNQVARAATGLRPSRRTDPPFVGRRRELAQLERCYQRLATTGAAVIVVGESGVGKSALVQQFVARLRARPLEDMRPPLVLEGRCHERESVPYKAFDGIIDELSRVLVRMSRDAAAALMPPRVQLVAQVFPVLRRVEAVSASPRRDSQPVGDHERRAAMFASLRELLRSLAAAQPLVLVIDDVQWIDVDSLSLLRELLRPPDAPRLMLVATRRSDAGGIDMRLSGAVDRIELGGLDDDEARDLVRHLAGVRDVLGSDPSPFDRVADEITDEARGHPLFIAELVRYTQDHPGQSVSQLRLDAALWTRIRRLDARLRRLLSIVAIAGGPLRQDAAARAAEAANWSELARWVAELRAEHLVHASGARAGDTVELYHDRVRHAVVANLAPEVRTICHRRLAIALEGTDADPEQLATHWLAAGERATAAVHAREAARRAEAAFAFDRAATLLRSVLDLSDPHGAERSTLLAQLGDALVSAGRCAEAADVYNDAAELAAPANALELRRRAANHYLRTGHIREGMQTLERVLSAVDMRLPKTPARAVMSLLLARARLRLHGIRFRERPESQCDPADLVRIDVCWSAAIGLAMVDTIRGAVFQAKELRFALHTGEPNRVARALAGEALFSAAQGGDESPRAAALLAEGEALAERIGDPGAIGMASLVRGVTAVLSGRWRGAQAPLERSESILRDHCAGMSFELFNARYFQLLILIWTGQWAEVGLRMPRLRQDADERGDRYAGAVLRNGLSQIHPLVLDDPEEAKRQSRSVIESLPGAFQFQHYWEALTRAMVGLYEGDSAGAWQWVQERWSGAKKSQVFRIQYIRIEAHWLRGRVAVAAAAQAPAGERGQLLEVARRDAAQLAGEEMGWAAPMALAVRAGAARVAGEDTLAITLAREAMEGFDAADMAMFAAAVRHQLGGLIGGDDGVALTRAAVDAMRAQGVRRPDRIAALFAPGV